MEIYSALILGLVGSLHCAGMCGPIALALPLTDHSWFQRIAGGLIYNSGRIITYGILGAIFGLAGFGLALGGLQQMTSVAAGIIMILSVLIPGLGNFSSRIGRMTGSFTAGLKNTLRGLFNIRSNRSLFAIGILNGFLPCGLVYVALAGALVTGQFYRGALYMILFGIATIPVLLAISVAGNLISLKFRSRLNRAVPYFMVFLGILFILRGLNLGIPYISPKLSQHDDRPVMECCEPKN